MKKVVLSLVAAMIAVVSFAQPLVLRSAQQKLSLTDAKQTTVKRTLGMRPTFKNVQAPSTSFFMKTPRKAAEGAFSVADLAGDYISAMYGMDYDEKAEELVPVIPACSTGMVSIEPGEGNEITLYGLLSVYGDFGELGVKATVNLEDFTITIPNNQVIAIDKTYGAIRMVNAESESDLTATIYANGIAFDQLWMATIIYEGQTTRFSEFFGTMLKFPNGVMTFKDEDGPVECYVAVEQNEKTKILTVFNFGNFGSVVDISIESDRTFTIDDYQVVAYDPTRQDPFYPCSLEGEVLGIISGTCTENVLTSSPSYNWTFYSEQGYWYGEMTPFTIELAGELQFPVAEVGDLVVAPANLQTVNYPLTATLYADVTVPYSATVKLGWEGKELYIQGLDKDFPEAWVKGKLNDRNYVLIPPTYMGTKDGTSHFFAAYDPEGADTLALIYDAEANTLEAAGTVLIYKGLNTKSSVYFYNGLFIGEKPSIIAPPAGIETVDMPFTGNYMNEYMKDPIEKNGTVKFARDGENVYIKGLFDEEVAEGGWIQGVFYNDTIVVFPMNQYTGVLFNGLNVYLVGYDPETEAPSSVVMIYNKENNFYTALNSVILTRFKSSFNFTSFYQGGLTIGSNPASIKSLEKASTADKSAYYTLNGVRIAHPTKKGVYIHNGKKFVVK